MANSRSLCVKLLAVVGVIAALLVFQNCAAGFQTFDAFNTKSLSQDYASKSTDDLATRFWFFPNQLGAQKYYQPRGQLINGHWAESFSQFSYWPKLSNKLAEVGGGVGLIITEMAYMNKAQIDDIRGRGLRIQVDEMQWTQCRDGYEGAHWELFGGKAGNQTLADLILAGTPAPYVGIYDQGFFRTKDGFDVVPDEVVLDERIPNLVPYLDIQALANPAGTWEERKARARRDPCPAASSFNPGRSRIEGLMYDYVEFAKVLQEKWPVNTPKLSFHWNANHGWDLGRDERCFDQQRASEMAAGRPDPYLDPSNVAYMRFPCHNGVPTLRDLIVTMCMAGHCPHTVYMDMDLSYNNDWLIEDLRRYREILRAIALPDGRQVSINYGLNVHDHCYVQGDNCYRRFENGALTNETSTGAPNLLFEESTLNVTRFLKHHGVLDEQTHVKFFTWDLRPREVGAQVKESIPGSMAHAALAYLEQTPPAVAPRLVPAMVPQAIQMGVVAAGTPIVCDHLNPDAIKNLSTKTIEWLATLQPSGLTLHENYFVARQQGYSGAFGRGEHVAWMDKDSERRAQFDAAVSALANTPTAPYASFRDHHVGRRNAGYRGLFLCGGDACFSAGQCDDLGRRR